MQTSALPFPIELAHDLFIKQRHIQRDEEALEALLRAEKELDEIVRNKEILDLFKSQHEFFIFAVCCQRGLNVVYFLDGDGLHSITERVNKEPGSQPHVSIISPKYVIKNTVDYGQFKVNEIIPALQFKIKKLMEQVQ